MSVYEWHLLGVAVMFASVLAGVIGARIYQLRKRGNSAVELVVTITADTIRFDASIKRSIALLEKLSAARGKLK